MFRRYSLPTLLFALIAMMSLAGTPRSYEDAQREFRQHNYKAALDILERLDRPDDDRTARQVDLLRARCQIRLRPTEDQLQSFADLLKGDQTVGSDPQLHDELADASRRRRNHHHIAIEHYKIAHELWLQRPNIHRQHAAQAAIDCATLLSNFDDFEKLTGWVDEVPADWQQKRALQVKLASDWFDRGIALADDDTMAAKAMLQKADLFERDLYRHADKAQRVVALYQDVVDRAPRSREAAQADIRIGQLYNRRLSQYAKAADHYRDMIKRYKGTDAAKRADAELDRIVAPTVTIWSDAPTPAGDNATIHFRTRNAKRVDLQAWSIDLFAFAREQHRNWSLGDWLPDGHPVASWTQTLPDDGTHQWIDSNSNEHSPIALPTTDPGAYMIEAVSDRGAKARTLLLVSDLALVTKVGTRETIVWSTDANNGEPISDVDLLVQRREGSVDLPPLMRTTDKHGLASIDRSQNKANRLRQVFARHGQHYATTQTGGGWYWSSRKDGLFVYSFCDRPIYKPGDTVHFKHIVRRYRSGTYEVDGGTTFAMTVYDSRGQEVFNENVASDKHGIVVGSFELPGDAALGLHRIQLQSGGRYVDVGSGGNFRVEEYRKPEFEVTINPGDGEPAFGQPTDVTIAATYLFGSPVADAPVRVTIHRTPIQPRMWFPYGCGCYFRQLGPMIGGGRGVWWWPQTQRRDLIMQAELVTDASGVARLSFVPAEPEQETGRNVLGYRFEVSAEVSDPSNRVVTGTGSISVTETPFTFRVTPQRWIYQPGDRVHIDIEANDANDNPVAFGGVVRLHTLRKAEKDDGGNRSQNSYELGDEIARAEVSADASGQAVFRHVIEEEGHYRFAVESKRDGRTITGACDVWLAKRDGSLAHHAHRDIEITLDRMSYGPGDNAAILFTSRQSDAHAMLTIEADGWVDEQVVHLSGGSAIVDLPITRRHTPNFFVTATLVHDHVVHQDMMPVIVPPLDRFLNVSIDGLSQHYGPRDDLSATLRITDHKDQPVAADAAVMIVDESLYLLQPELRTEINEYYYGDVRRQGVQTHTSFASLGRGIRRGFDDGRLGMAMSADAPAAAVVARAAPEARSSRQEFATPDIRSEFPDAIRWIGNVRTDADGLADINVTLPDSLTTWRLTAIAIDEASRVGETRSDAIVRKNIIARLQTPRFLVEQDRCLVSVIARNDFDTVKDLRVSLESAGPIMTRDVFVNGERVERGDDGSIVVSASPRSEVVVDFELVAKSPGLVELTAAAAADIEADAVRKELPILTYGAQTLLTDTGTMRDFARDESQIVTLHLPEEMDPNAPILEVHFRPTIAGVLIDAIPYLVEYPYGCTEQTMSRFMPAVLTRQSLQSLGVSLDQLAALAGENVTDPRHPERKRTNPVFDQTTLNDVIAAGVERLTSLQRPDGGWGWWRGGSADPYMTAYVVQGLAEGREAGVPFDASVLKRGFDFLRRHLLDPSASRHHWYRQSRARELNTRAWMLFALSYDTSSRRSKDFRAILDDIYNERDDLTDYGRAMLALVLHRANDASRAGTAIANLENTVVRENDLAHWGQADGYYYWYQSGIESTAMVLRALLAVDPNHADIPNAVNWLVRSRQASQWHSTKSTALAIHALAAYLETSQELQADMQLTVTIDGHLSRKFDIDATNVLSSDLRMIVAPRHLTPGPHTVQIEKTGRGHLYYAVFADFFTKQDPIPPAGDDITVKRTHYLLREKTVQKTRRVWDSVQRKMIDQPYDAIDYDRTPIETGQPIPAGSLIEVSLAVHSTNDFDYILIEDPKPAGFEPADLHSGYATDDGGYAHRELRDKHVAFFLNRLNAGDRTFTYRLRSENAGEFRVLPTRVEAMYSPYLRANSASETLAAANTGR